MAFPSQRDVDALTSFEDDEFDALLSGAGSKLAPSKTPASSSASAAQSSSTKSPSSRARSTTVAVTDPSQSAQSVAPTSSKAAALGDGRAAAAAPAPMTFGSTAFLSELQNRRKLVMQDSSLKAGASDDDADSPPSAAPKPPRPAAASGPSSAGPQPAAAAAPAPAAAAAQAVGSKVAEPPAAPPSSAAAERPSDAPDASACLRRIDRLPSTVEKCMKEYDDACVEETKGLLGGLFKYCKKKFAADQGIYTAEDVVALLKESFAHVSQQWAESHEDHSASTVATISKAASRIRKDVVALAAQACELHATMSSAEALGIGGGGGGKSVAEVVEMAQEIQALKKKVEKLKAKQKAQEHKVAELQVWEESVPMLRSMLEEAMEQKAQLQAEKEDCTRLRKGMALTWVPDAAAHKCLNCEVVFGLRKWKNHCRYCGRVFCWDCTSRKLEIRELGYNYEVPVCDHCHNLLSNK